MPLIDVTYDASVTPDELRQLAESLPDLVARAVECAEEPWLGPPEPGDIEIRFKQRGPFDVGDLRCVVEVRTTLFGSREENKQERADMLRSQLVDSIGPGVGVWLILLQGAWSQAA